VKPFAAAGLLLLQGVAAASEATLLAKLLVLPVRTSSANPPSLLPTWGSDGAETPLACGA
jgi:hypothetical protein